jgi:diguanylate cyclase (GGDEF)-like protein
VLNELAERDGMTGLYNRRIFDDYVERLWRQSRRESTGVAIIFVDIDFFKVYNDLYGHQAGDDCLKRISKCIARGAKRPFDFAARYGGEEFVLVLYGPPEEYARSVPEQIRRDVLELGIPHAGSQAGKHVTVSVGLAMAKPETSRSLAGAIQTADEALYQAKREGRNRVVFKDSDSDDVETGNFRVIQRDLAYRHQVPVFGIEAHGSAFGNAEPFCSSSIEMLSGERMNAILPSRGGRLIVTPAPRNRSHTA